MKKRLYIFVLCMLMVLMLPLHCAAEDMGDGSYEEQMRTVKGRVHAILEDEIESYGGGYEMRYQIADIEILEGEYAGRVIEVRNDVTVYNLVLSEGNDVLMYLFETEDGAMTAYVSDIVRGKYLIWIVAIFLVLLGLIGGIKGIKTIVSLLITVGAAVFILLPLVAGGKDPITVSTLVCFGVTIVTLLILNGFSLKTLAAIFGTSGGILIAAILAWLFSYAAKLTGMGNEYAQMLAEINAGLDFRGLLFAAIMLGSLGAVMDVSMSIASSMNEIITIDPGLPGWRLFKHGITIGRDVMGTMSNTLILAYFGGALHLLLYFMMNGVPFRDIINRDLIASEVVRALAGSIGLVLTVPLTVLITVVLRSKEQIAVDEEA